MIKKFLNKLPGPVRAGVTTALVSFFTVLGTSLAGWLNSFASAIANGEKLPSFSTLQSAVLSAGVAAVIGLVNFLFRQIQTSLGLGNPPNYDKSDKPE